MKKNTNILARTLMAGALLMPGLTSNAQEEQSSAVSVSNAIRPFHINVPESELVDLRRRVLATRWPDRETVGDQSQGVKLHKIQKLVAHWGTSYDWRKAEKKFNALPQFIT